MEFETEIRMEAGKPLPRGAHWDGREFFTGVARCFRRDVVSVR